MLRGQLRPAILLTLLLCVLTGFIYPGIVTGLAQLLFPNQANGSLVKAADGHVLGSSLIGQNFSKPEYFHPRPSAAGAGAGYDDTLSGGTNLGPTSRKLADTLVAGAVATVVQQDGAARGHIPSDMVTSSASGLDPHISPANAQLQVMRVARARGAAPAAIRALVDAHTERRTFGLLGEPRVNVLELNLALDRRYPVRPSANTAANTIGRTPTPQTQPQTWSQPQTQPQPQPWSQPQPPSQTWSQPQPPSQTWSQPQPQSQPSR